MSSLGYVLTMLLLSVFMNRLHNEIENMKGKYVDDTSLGGIKAVFKDSIRFQGDLSDPEKSFMLLLGGRKKRIQRGADVDHVGHISHDDKNICNEEKSNLQILSA